MSDINIGAQAALIRTRLTTWLPTATDGLHAIGAFATILDFEINRMYEAWYPEPEQLEIADESRKAVLNASRDRKRTKYATYFDAHCGKAQKKWRSFRLAL